MIREPKYFGMLTMLTDLAALAGLVRPTPRGFIWRKPRAPFMRSGEMHKQMQERAQAKRDRKAQVVARNRAAGAYRSSTFPRKAVAA